MAIIIYFAAAFMLLRFCVSENYRIQTRERWKRTPRYRVINEVGAGIIGLAVIVTIIVVIIVSSRN